MVIPVLLKLISFCASHRFRENQVEGRSGFTICDAMVALCCRCYMKKTKRKKMDPPEAHTKRVINRGRSNQYEVKAMPLADE